MKKIFVLTLVFMLLLSTSSVFATDNLVGYSLSVSGNNTTKFSDLSNSNWAYEYIKNMSNKRIIKGFPDGSFRPNNTLTYAEFIKMVLIASTNKDVGNSSTGHWGLNYYNEALNLGYFTKSEIAKSDLSKAITRSNMALIISNAVIGGYDSDKFEELSKNLKDISYSTNNRMEILKVYSLGIITGYEDNTFRPNRTLTRAESSAVIYRLIDENARIKPEVKTEEELENTTNEKLLSDIVDLNSPYNNIPDSIIFTEDYITETPAENEIYLLKDNGKDGFSLVISKINGGMIAVKDKKPIYCNIYWLADKEGNKLNKSVYYCPGFDKSEIDYFIYVGTIWNEFTSIKIDNPFK